MLLSLQVLHVFCELEWTTFQYAPNLRFSWLYDTEEKFGNVSQLQGISTFSHGRMSYSVDGGSFTHRAFERKFMPQWCPFWFWRRWLSEIMQIVQVRICLLLESLGHLWRQRVREGDLLLALYHLFASLQYAGCCLIIMIGGACKVVKTRDINNHDIVSRFL